MWKRIWAIIVSRNKEFYRDKSALGWNILFPFMVIIGFSVLFSEDKQVLYKVGIIESNINSDLSSESIYENIKNIKYVQLINFSSQSDAFEKLKKHKVDIIIEKNSDKYWVSKTSPKSYIIEKIILSSENQNPKFKKQVLAGKEIPYIEWLFPGILGMNMMFSSLFGIGYVVVRYRKNGVLKRLSVTPVRAYEFLIAQVLSRIFVLMVTTIIVYVGCSYIFDFSCKGSLITLFFIFALGGFSMITLGLLIAARSSSEEFAGGILNLISWPMMFLSEVWFSLEGAEQWVKKISKIFPLTQMIDGVRKVMNEGATISDVKYQVISLTLMSVVFMIIGSFLFKWKKDL